jgi:hypothetical protein
VINSLEQTSARRLRWLKQPHRNPAARKNNSLIATKDLRSRKVRQPVPRHREP